MVKINDKAFQEQVHSFLLVVKRMSHVDAQLPNQAKVQQK